MITPTTKKFARCNVDAQALLCAKGFAAETCNRVNDSLFAEFAKERMKAFYARQIEEQYVSKFDTINKHRYTNPYRILDRTSQGLVKSIAMADYNNVSKAFLCFMFRICNAIKTYEDINAHLTSRLGVAWATKALKSETVLAETITGAKLIVTALKKAKLKAYRFAYKLHCAESFITYFDKLSVFLSTGFLNEFDVASSLVDYYNLISKIKGFGPFLAYQLALDWNYCRDQPFPITFVVPGPGAKVGAGYVFGAESPTVLIARIKLITLNYHDVFDDWFDYKHKGVDMTLKENDVQNIFCEYSKFFEAHVIGDKPKRKLETKPTAMPVSIPEGYLYL